MNLRHTLTLTLSSLVLLTQSVTAAPAIQSDLAGEWMFGALSFTNYRDASTGRLTDDGGGIGDKIKINIDGSYERASRSKFTQYTCTTLLALWERGTVQVSGQTLKFRPREGVLRSEDTCNAKFNYQKSVSAWTRSYSIARDSYNRIGLTLKADGSGVTYWRQLKAGL